VPLVAVAALARPRLQLYEMVQSLLPLL
jgi:hypothetical protein